MKLHWEICWKRSLFEIYWLFIVRKQRKENLYYCKYLALNFKFLLNYQLLIQVTEKTFKKTVFFSSGQQITVFVIYLVDNFIVDKLLIVNQKSW
jgi:hypothetical protein